MNEGSILKDMGAYKNKLLSAFINSGEICQLLLDRPQYTAADAEKLIYSQIFPYLYSDEAQTENLTFLCVEVDVSGIPTNTVKDMKLTVWAYCHKDSMKYSQDGYLGTRVDILSDMVERQLRGLNAFGIGKLQLESVTHFSPGDKYYGKQLVYHLPDFKFKK